ncbi:hypothetical protein M0R04_14600 [Candidatus Dojkabacteria bacterium]|jgi:hypothetical protein|nr:hypothetical protein [Candidatus Dojkabacteria bacterium]
MDKKEAEEFERELRKDERRKTISISRVGKRERELYNKVGSKLSKFEKKSLSRPLPKYKKLVKKLRPMTAVVNNVPLVGMSKEIKPEGWTDSWKEKERRLFFK